MKKEVNAENPQQLYWKKTAVYLILLLGVFVSAVMVAFQVFEYRHDYREYTSYQRERDDISAE